MRRRLEQLSLAMLAIGLIALMCAIVVQVACSALDINPILAFETSVGVLGKAITLNSLLDLQWHLLLITGLLPVGLIWLMDRHVRVDFLYMSRPVVVQNRINLIGNIVFGCPFLALALPAAWSFFLRAWGSDEGSRNGGLNDLWLIKFVIPLGLALLALAVLLESYRLLRALR